MRMTESDRHAAAELPDWSEDLPLLAARGYTLGKALCRCEAHYHALWGIRRAAGLFDGRGSEEEVLRRIVASAAEEGTRVLIAGAADTGTLGMAGRAAGGRLPRITVLDRCAAPLELIRQFCAERAIPCATLHVDLLELAEEKKWDVALLHYTLSFISPKRRREALRRLARSLTPGGTLICAARIGAPAGAGLDDAAWVERARRAVRVAGLKLPLDEAELEELLKEGAAARRNRWRTNHGLADLKADIAGAGLRLTGEWETARKWMPSDATGGKAEAARSVVLTAKVAD